MPTLKLKTDFITLAQALKAADQASSGGEAKQLVRGGEVLVNGVVETQVGRKLRAGDSFRLGADAELWLIEAP